MKKLNLFLVAIFMIAFVGCQMNSETPLEITNNEGEQTTPGYPYVENDEHEHNWVEFVPTSSSVIGESSSMKCSLCGTVCVHEIEHTDEPTCTESVLLKCKCGKVTHNENALGHDFGNNLEKCNRCGIANPNYVVITDTNANGNEEPTQTEEPKSDNPTPPTDSDTDEDDKQTPPHEHNFVKVSDATCTEPSTEKCECGEVTHNVNALGHDYTVFVETIEPTVNAQGYDLYKCSRCEEEEKRNFKNYVPKYVCNGCNTVYNTETEKDNCNKQNGCPNYLEPISPYYLDEVVLEYEINDTYKSVKVTTKQNRGVIACIYKGYLIYTDAKGGTYKIPCNYQLVDLKVSYDSSLNWILIRKGTEILVIVEL